MNRVRNVLWGIILVVAGVIIGLKVLNIITFNIFFDGWWTLFIIVPSFVGLITDRDKTASIVGLVAGGILLLSSQDIIDGSVVWKLIFPIIIVLIGIKLIFKDFFNKAARDAKKRLDQSWENAKKFSAAFSAQNVDFSGEVFSSAKLTSTFGDLKCDLRNAAIADEAVIDVCCVFGGIDITLPENVNVKTSLSSAFGGLGDKRNTKNTNGAVTVYITGKCIFGGVNII